MKQKKILVLGAGGFIGTHLINKLNAEGSNIYKTQAVGFNVSKYQNLSNVSFIEGSINNKLLNKCDYPDIIYHVAGGASVPASISDPYMDFNKTVLNINDILNKIKEDWPLSKLVYVSSASVYGSNASENTRVSTEKKPISPYGLHKKITEDLIEFYRGFYNVNATIIRPFSIYGPGLKKQLFWDSLKKSEAGNFDYFGSGLEKRDWIYIVDFIDLLVGLYAKDNNYSSKCSETINVGSGNGITNEEVINNLLTIAGYSKKANFIEKNKIGDPCDLVSSFAEQKESAEFYKTPINIGLTEYVKWYKGL